MLTLSQKLVKNILRFSAVEVQTKTSSTNRKDNTMQGHATTEDLKDRDYVLVLDKSGSMGSYNDTPSGQTRWEEAKESTLAIANHCQKLDPDGITVVPFAGDFKVYESTTPEKVKDVFAENEPMGNTYLAAPLKATFESYLKRKAEGKAKTHGEITLVVTDGCPQDAAEVAREITAFTKKLERDEEYGICFLQIGKDKTATSFLQSLDNDLEKHGARFDIVTTKTIEEVEKNGLTATLLSALND
jgi:Mg-chelatase subunit ChlD